MESPKTPMRRMEPPKTPLRRKKRCLDGSDKGESSDGLMNNQEEEVMHSKAFGFDNPDSCGQWMPETSYRQLFRALLTARKFPPVETLPTDDKKSPLQKNSSEAFAASPSCKTPNPSCKMNGEDPPIKKIVVDPEIENQPQTRRKNKYFYPKIDDRGKAQKTKKNDDLKPNSGRNPKASHTCPISNPEMPHMCPVTPMDQERPLLRKFEQTPDRETIETPRKFGKSCRRALLFDLEDQVNEGDKDARVHDARKETCFRNTSLRQRQKGWKKGSNILFEGMLVPKKKRSKLAIIDALIKQLLCLSCNEIEKHTSTCFVRGRNCECSGENLNAIKEENQVNFGCDQIQECQCCNHTGSSMKLFSKKQKEVQTTLVPYHEKEKKLALALYKKNLIPKVDIDQETVRVWNLLMMGEEVPEDEYTKSWWQKEKKLLYDNVEMFITRMHVIQGDRRFSRWKGSVVDSVIGVFLTQNVSDTLSSSAFMALAAKYPVKSQHCTNNERGDVKDESTNNQNQNQNQNENSKNWDELRKKYSTGKQRNPNTWDSADWEAVRRAPVEEVAEAIKERGQNNILAKRIKQFLERIVQDHGSIDLEWLRDVPPNEAKEYLLSIPGIGLKSVECIRLLCLEHHAFPVDTNVGRVAVRLGWVPLQPLPEEVQIHELKKYPVLDGIQRYLWPRLQELEQRKLYELHYHMITFGKVFCTKVNPNCNVCPMKENCMHFASAFASAKLRLPGPQEKAKARTHETCAGGQGPTWNARMADVFLLESNNLESTNETPNCEPIIELPESPRPMSHKYLERDIEDLCCDDDDDSDGEIPTIVLNPETFRQNVLAALEKHNLMRQNSEVVKSLVAVSPEAASIPAPRLMSLSKLRTVHQVYELDDESPILEGFEKRDPEETFPYLFRMWMTGDADNPIQEYDDQIVLGSVLIPCRTANRGSFPLNGTYFQPNEVFADYESSHNPIPVPRELLWNKPRRSLYCGTSVTAIHRGFTQLIEVQRCCYRGYYCTRGFERKTRAPRPLPKRFHPSRETGNKKSTSKNMKDNIGK